MQQLVLRRACRHDIEVDDDTALKPWMLFQDWREETRPYLTVDMAVWPADVPMSPLPPLPLIGIGPVEHPLSAHMDVIEDEAVPIARAIDGVRHNPRAAAALIDLLRITQAMPADAALTCESFAYATLQAGDEHRAWRAGQRRGPRGTPGSIQIMRTNARLDVLLNRPKQYNAIDREMRDRLFDAFIMAVMDHNITHVSLSAAGRCFSIGADLDEFGTIADPTEAHRIRSRTLPARALLGRPEVHNVHVHGGCVGAALELAAFAHRFTARADAWFQLPEISMGIIPGAGGCVSLPRRIGRQRAALLMLSGKRISATTALRWGLVDALVDDSPSYQSQSDLIG